MNDKIDLKKEYKDLYNPKTKPSIIDVPEMIFLAVDGKGNPNSCEEYKNAIEILYGLSYAIKMSNKNGTQPDGYYEYVVPPLEGFWWSETETFNGLNAINKDNFCWTSVIRQPEFVTQAVFEKAKEVLARKKPNVDFSSTRLIKHTEGMCVQIMHIGSYDNEPVSISGMEQFAIESGYSIDISVDRKHHEIYLGDPRKTSAEKLKTIIRHPILERQ